MVGNIIDRIAQKALDGREATIYLQFYIGSLVGHASHYCHKFPVFAVGALPAFFGNCADRAGLWGVTVKVAPGVGLLPSASCYRDSGTALHWPTLVGNYIITLSNISWEKF